MTGLETYALKELLDELDARFESMIFAGKLKADKDNCIDVRTTGSHCFCIGLCECIKHDIMEQRDKIK